MIAQQMLFFYFQGFEKHVLNFGNNLFIRPKCWSSSVKKQPVFIVDFTRFFKMV